MVTYSEKTKQRKVQYAREKYKRIPLDVKIEEYNALKIYIDNNKEETGGSINGFIRKLIKDKIENENTKE